MTREFTSSEPVTPFTFLCVDTFMVSVDLREWNLQAAVLSGSGD